MFGILKFKRQRNYDIIYNALKSAGIDSEVKAKKSIKQTIENGKSGTILVVLVSAILLLIFPSVRSMLLAISLIILCWIWASVYNGKKQIERFVKEEILNTKAKEPTKVKEPKQ